MSPLLSIQDLSIDFITEGIKTAAVKHVSLQVNTGEILAIVGESGSGKSVTSLSILQLLPHPPANYAGGKILFTEKNEQVDLLAMKEDAIKSIRGKKISMIFQEPMTSLNPVLTCGSQVMEAILIHKKISYSEARKQTIDWFQKVKLPNPEVIFNRYPHQLSGGQKQRVMIAIAMCCNPSLLVCDEPTTALDVTVQKTILSLIKDLQQQHDMGVIFITHDLGVVAEIADRVAIMYKGEIIEEESTARIFNEAKHPYTKALIACRPALHPKGERLPTVADFMDPHKDEVQPVTHKQIVHATGEPLLEVENLIVQFSNKSNFLGKTSGYITAVDDVSFIINKNETVGLVGESGCGKTTIGRTLLLLTEPTSGKIKFQGNDITKLNTVDLKQLRKDVQLVFQDPYSSLNPRLTIGAAIAEPLIVMALEPSKEARRKRVASLLELVGLSPSLMNRYPHEFSGGQRQRIVIARALALKPTLLLCDESVSALDVSVQAQVLNLLNDLKKELGLTLLFISHDLSVVRYMCDRIMIMNKGKIVETGPAEEVYTHPKTAYTKNLVEAIPVLQV